MITVKARGIDAIIKRLERRRDGLEDKLHLLIEKLGTLGIQVADTIFKDAPYDGVRDVAPGVLTWKGKTSAEISVSGTTVLFIEFGTGIHFNTGETYGLEHGFGPGTYGPNGLRDYWIYEGPPGNAGGVASTKKPGFTITHGNPPSKAMYAAGKQMREQIETIAKEVFG